MINMIVFDVIFRFLYLKSKKTRAVAYWIVHDQVWSVNLKFFWAGNYSATISRYQRVKQKRYNFMRRPSKALQMQIILEELSHIT